MKAEIITLTPVLAKTLLEKNVGNRRMKKRSKTIYARQMLDGTWKENGEPIIVDSNGFVKDGQHRLNAVIQTGHSYKVPLITGVDPNVMDTIDTGTNRSLVDVLELNGFKYASLMSTVIKTVIKHDLNRLASSDSGDNRIAVTNNKGLEYARANEEKLYKFCRAINIIRDTSTNKVLGYSDIAWFLYAIAGLDVKADHIAFMKGVYSGRLGDSSATYYAYTKFLNAKLNKVGLNKAYGFNLVVKCWEIYANGDMPVKSLRIRTDKLDEVKTKIDFTLLEFKA